MTMKGKGEKVLPFLCYGDEYLMECPYNMAHQVTNARMMTHIIKCRRNWSKQQLNNGDSVLMLVCKYNWQHQVHAPEILHHEMNCSDRLNVVTHFLEYTEEDPTKPDVGQKKLELYMTLGATHNAIVPEPVVIKPEEKREDRQPKQKSHRGGGPSRKKSLYYDDDDDWELDLRRRGVTESYNPYVVMEHEVMMSYPPNLTKSERRAFLTANREKARRLIALGINPLTSAVLTPDTTPGSTPASSVRPSAEVDDPESSEQANYGPKDCFRPSTDTSEAGSRLDEEEAALPEVLPAENYKCNLENALKSGLAGLRRREEVENDLKQPDLKQVQAPDLKPLPSSDSSEDEDIWVPTGNVNF